MLAFTDGPVTVHQGDVRECLRNLPAESVQVCVTSPPYWGLRDYGVDGQLGLEATLDEYVANMVAVFREVRRVLRKDATLWLNLGDAYAANAAHVPSGLKPKDLIGLPWRVAFALQADGWWLRSDIIWAKPNPMPESVTNRPTKAHEYLFLLTKAARYYYDAAAIREPYSPETKALSFETMDFKRRDEYKAGRKTKVPGGWDQGEGAHGTVHRNGRTSATYQDAEVREGANKRSVWTVATQAYPDAHFATYPEDLVIPCIKAGSREGDVVLDPFAGSGTTLAVARRLGRRAVGIELNPVYIDLIRQRVSKAALPLLEGIG